MTQPSGFENPEHVPHPVDDRPPAGRLVLYGLQHLLTFYAAIVVLPAIIAAGIGLSARDTAVLLSAVVFTGGIGTLIQSIGLWKIGIRLPLVLGGSSVVIGPAIAIGNAHGGGVTGLLTIYGAAVPAGLVVFLAAPLYGRLLRFFPPLVTGTVITMVGLAILPIGVTLAGGGDASAATFGSPRNLAIAGATVLTVVVAYRVTTGLLRSIAILIGLVVGGVVGVVLGAVDFSGVAEARWLAFVGPFHFGWPRFDLSAVVSMSIAMIIVAVESTASFFAVGAIVGRAPDQRAVTRGVLGEGLATMLGGAFSPLPPTTFNGNVGLVRTSNVRSRFVCAVAGVFMIVLSCLPKVAAVAAALPKAAVGGALLVLFGTIATVGIHTLSRADLSSDRNLITVAVSLGAGTVPVAQPQFFHAFPQQLQVVLKSGIVVTALVAITLNIFFNHLGSRTRQTQDAGALAAE
ncbi:nucleobase:cation symporter-2 family protein [Streptomyces sp. NPDC001508]|uniref:nucleobase:cation symporter-2 family protein n=1 Tax=Streptomyces sp. NPDC001508 TaxID=3154656 RepID=UPI00331BFCB8